MDTKTRIRRYEQFREALGETKHYQQLAELNENYPDLYKRYKERLEKEKLKESNPLAYYLRYGGNPSVEV